MPSAIGQHPHAALIAVRDALRLPPVEELPSPQVVEDTPMGRARNPTKWESLMGVIQTLCYAILISPFGFQTRNLEVLVGQAERPVVYDDCRFCSEVQIRQDEFNEWLHNARDTLTLNYNTQSDYTNASRFAWVSGAASALAFYDAMPMLATLALVASVATLAFLIYQVAKHWNDPTTLPMRQDLDRLLTASHPDDAPLTSPESLALQSGPHEPGLVGAPAAVALATGAVDPHTSERAPPLLAPPAGPAAPPPGPAAGAGSAPPALLADDCKLDPQDQFRPFSPAAYQARSAVVRDPAIADAYFGDKLKSSS